jgi:thymidylate synthase ThyX
MLLAEHSPIRLVEYDITFEDIKQWVTVHLVRHWLGFIPFVHSQREDRRKLDVPRDELPQGALNDMDVSINAQSMINVSRKRLCSKASPETRDAWQKVVDAVGQIDPVMAEKCVPNCVYRGFCPELESCGFVNSPKFKEMLEKYRNTNYDESN